MKKQLETNTVLYCKMMAHERWTAYFKIWSTIKFFSKSLKVAKFYFSIIFHDTNVEQIFSLMQPQWSKEREFLESVASILTVVYNVHDVTCSQFYDMAKNDSTLLTKVKGTSKYPWAKFNK